METHLGELKPCIFSYKKDTKKTFGFIAQDILEFFPEETYTIVRKDDKGLYSVDYGQIVPLLVKEVQLLKKRVLQLEEIMDQKGE